MISSKNKKILYILILIVLPIIIKLYLSSLEYGPTDIILYEEWTATFDKGLDPYIPENNPSSVPVGYGPLLFYIMYLAYKVSVVTGVPFNFLEKIPIILFDTLISLIIFLVLKKKYSLNVSLFWSLLFALNPLTIINSSIYGQYNSIPVFFLLLSYLSFQSKNRYLRIILPSIFVGFAGSLKMVALLFIPLVFFRYKTLKEKALSFISIISVFVISFILSTFPIKSFFNVMFYFPKSSHTLNWGFAKFLLVIQMFVDIGWLIEALKIEVILFPMLLILISFLIRKKPLLDGYLIIFFSMFSFLLFIHTTYLYWVLPFLFLKPSIFSSVYWIPATLHIGFLRVFFLILGYTWQLSNILSFGFGIITWFFCLYGFWKYLKVVKRVLMHG